MVATVTSPGASEARSGKASSAGSFRYRPDIDALRGVAMLAVLVFHLNNRWLPGGFTGVDVFYVISGYVVMGSLLSHANQPLGPRLGNFYLRRVRRLLPHLLLCLGVTSVAVAMLIPPAESGPYFIVALKALFAWSNNYLMGQFDYFSSAADLNPFLHTWSLGVEQQFYLVFPLLMVGIGYGVRRSVPLMAALAVLSLGACLWWTQTAPMAAFFLMPSRLWELVAGGMLLMAQRRGMTGNWPRGRWLRLVGGVVLLAALVWTSKNEGFPGPGAVPAVVGTLLILQAGPNEDGRFLPGRWLERALLTCGLLSYALYLWHWPVIVLLRWTWGLEQWWQYVVAVVVSVVLALLGYQLVEQPVRRHPLSVGWELGATALAMVGLWIGIDALHYRFTGKLFVAGDPNELPFNERLENLRLPGTEIGSTCTLEYRENYTKETRSDFEVCGRRGRPGSNEMFLLGDSHALHLLPMLDAVSTSTGQSISFTYMMACFVDPSMRVSWGNKSYGPCRQFALGELDRTVDRLKPGDVMILSNWLNYYLADVNAQGEATGAVVHSGDRRLKPAEARALYVSNLRAYATRLAAKGIELVLVVDNPPLALEPKKCRNVFAGTIFSSEMSCAPEPEVTQRMQQTLLKTLSEAASGLPNVHVFDPTPYLIKDDRVHYRRLDGTLHYTNDHHLSTAGSQLLAEPFQRFLERQGLVTAPR